MAEAGLFVGWGAPVRGRELAGLGVFQESIEYWGSQQAAGAIESFEVIILEPHGGDLAGFFLLRGTQDQITALRATEEYARLITRAGMVVERVGAVGAFLGDGLPEAVGRYQAAASELGG
jgi:hypothetical protein